MIGVAPCGFYGVLMGPASPQRKKRKTHTESHQVSNNTHLGYILFSPHELCMPSGKANIAIMLLKTGWPRGGGTKFLLHTVVLLVRCHFLFRGGTMACDSVMTDRNSSSQAWLQHPIVRN